MCAPAVKIKTQRGRVIRANGRQCAPVMCLTTWGICLGGKEGSCWCCSFQWWREVGGVLGGDRGRKNELLFWECDKKLKKKKRKTRRK